MAVTAAPGSSSAIASAIAPEPGADVEHRRRRQLERQLDQQLGLRPRDQHPRGRPRARSGESPCGRGCRRPARAAPAGGPWRRTRARRRASTPASGVGGEPRPVEPGRLGEQQLGVEPRACRPRRPRARRPPPRSASRDRAGGGRAHRSRVSAVCASSRARFSSAPSAEVNSLRSPPRTSSRLCAVSLIRWSVTRPWGKL